MTHTKWHRLWSKEEVECLVKGYGIQSVSSLSLQIGRERQSLYSKARLLGLTKQSVCKARGRTFSTSGHGKKVYCSKDCLRVANTARHRRYVEANRESVHRYTHERKIRIWGKSSLELASKAEFVAIERVLPKLGSADIFHASLVNRFFLFDLIATHEGRRVPIDVTAGVSKEVGKDTPKRAIAEALGMPLYVVFISPDFSKYQLVLSHNLKTLAIHVQELLPIE
jgi:hypothetical protein